MRIIKDTELLNKAIEELGLRSKFNIEPLHLRLCYYEKGELLSGSHIRQNYLLFVISGIVQIYGIGSDGRKIPVNLAKKGSIIGDVEFCNARNSNLISEVLKDTLCIGISIQENQAALENDIRFLRFLLEEISKKVYLTSVSDSPATSVAEKLLQYMKEECPSHTLKDVEQTTLRLQCSRRQLQRVLKELCEKEEIIKIRKGTYRLNI